MDVVKTVVGKSVHRKMYWYTLLRTLTISEFSIGYKVRTVNKPIISKEKGILRLTIKSMFAVTNELAYAILSS